MLDWLWPASISNATTVFLIFFSCLTSAITASLGAGGGVLLLATMAMVLPPAVIIPVHGIVQLGSNFNRAIMTLKDLDKRLIGIFALGSALGAWLASLFLVQLPIQTTQLTIAALILFLCWGPALPNVALGKLGTFVAAAITTFIRQIHLRSCYISQLLATRKIISMNMCFGNMRNFQLIFFCYF